MSQKAVSIRTRRSEKEWRELLAVQAGSGLSQRAFCVGRGLSLSSFTNARRRSAKAASTISASEFVPVATNVSERCDWEIELALGEGITLRLRRA